jgi:hypothetical protein
MRKALFFFLLIRIPSLCLSQQNYPGDTLYVWNLDGTTLRRQPSFSSGVADSLKFGTPLIIKSVLRNKPVAEKVVNTSVRLKGFWIRVKAARKTGYVFGGDCYTMNPFPVTGGEKGISLLDRFLGEKTGSKVVTKKYTFDNDTNSYFVKENITYFTNGTETSYYFDGCSSDDYYFPSASFTTVYHLMMLVVSYSVDTEGLPEPLTKPRLRAVWGKTYDFDGVDALEPQLEIRKHGIEMRLSSCD